MFVNKEMFSVQSSSNFAHADQVAPLEMEVRHADCVKAQSRLGGFFLSFFRLTDLIIER